MYEAELNPAPQAADQLPAAILARFGELARELTARTVLPWGEHCTECQYPVCYTTCELYQPRFDRHCRQFVDGMVRLDVPAAVNGYVLKIRFKRWGKLWTPGNTRLLAVARAQAIERRDIRLGRMIDQPVVPEAMRRELVRKRSGMKARLARLQRRYNGTPSSFVVECYNPNPRPVAVTVSVMYENARNGPPFQRRLDLPPGFTRARIPVSEILDVVDVALPFQVEITPNDVAGDTTLVFGLMDFVREAETSARAQTAARPSAACKCVVWDLDNTLWNGVLLEEGPSALVLKEGILDVIRELDRRGILQSVASKNDEAEVRPLLRTLGVEEYFLHPQIGWRPKSEAVRRIASALNIGTDSLAFIDDQAFEREEVRSAHPQVTIVDAAEYRRLLERPEFCVPVTAESAARRASYRTEARRQEALQAHGGEYAEFLRACALRLTVQPCAEDNLERVYELAQRTNQMNFSGNRYDRSRLAEVMGSSGLDSYVIECEDRFGAYGVIGFAIVDRGEPRLLDLMFSCRVQSKRVEHAFLSFLLRRYEAAAEGPFYANYRKTARNAPAGRVFADLGFEEQGEAEGVTRLVFPRGRPVPDDRIVEVAVRPAPALEPS